MEGKIEDSYKIDQILGEYCKTFTSNYFFIDIVYKYLIEVHLDKLGK